MVRILHIVPELDVNAGMMSVVMNYYRRIDRNKVQFDFLYLYDAPEGYASEIERLGGRTYQIGAPSFSVGFIRKIERFFAAHEGEYTALHCHPIWTPVLFAIPARRHGIRHVIAHSHSTQYSEKRLSAIRNRMFMPLIRLVATDYMACSQDAAALFKLRDTNSVPILHNAIDTDRFLFRQKDRDSIRSEFSISPESLLIGHVGRFSIEKNHVFLLRFFKTLLQSNPSAKLMLVGDGPLYEQVKNTAVGMGLASRVIFTGRRADVERILSAMDVFVLPSLFEGVPVVTIEAQASGLPCIISDTVTRKINFQNCEYIPIDCGEALWAEAVGRCMPDTAGRAEANALLAESRYNVKKETLYLQEYYVSMSD